jgi:hypothetical protein
VIRSVVSIAALLVALNAIAEPKVGSGGTPPAGGPSTTPAATPDKAATPAPGRSEAARKALGALKGGNIQDRRRPDERKPRGR